MLSKGGQREMNLYFRLIIALMVLLFAGETVLAYEVIEVTNGGTINGTVRFVGAPPQDPEIEVTKNQEYCGNELPREKYLISKDGAIRNVFVVIENIEKGRAVPKEATTIDNSKCAFVSHVSIGYKGNKVAIKNSDPILHNTHLYSGIGGRTLYNLSLADEGQVVEKPLRKAGLVDVQCDAHKWMQGYMFVLEHPYGAVTDEAGSFAISDVPPGKYTLKAWHEALGELTEEVEVTAGGTAEASFEFKGAGE